VGSTPIHLRHFPRGYVAFGRREGQTRAKRSLLRFRFLGLTQESSGTERDPIVVAVPYALPLDEGNDRLPLEHPSAADIEVGGRPASKYLSPSWF
jgi:hypothetical protein